MALREQMHGLVRTAVNKSAPVARLCTRGVDDYSRLFMVGDEAGWVLDEERRSLQGICGRLGIREGAASRLPWYRRQAVFYGGQFHLLGDEWLKGDHHVGLAYFHGRPGSGVPEFDELCSNMRSHRDRIQRVQVSHSEMEGFVADLLGDASKVHRIPIGIDVERFQPAGMLVRSGARRRFDLPESAFVVGSFQKDGCGWGEGDEPKLIKGPDVFVRAMCLLHERVPELHVLLTGPARGYVKRGLAQAGIPYRHAVLESYADIPEAFHALDLYVAASRQEGGPKAILESMATGVPLVTTRVGQAMDLVVHGQNAHMVEVEDVDGLVHWSQWVAEHPSDVTAMCEAGLRTARENAYGAQDELWRHFLEGFVTW